MWLLNKSLVQVPYAARACRFHLLLLLLLLPLLRQSSGGVTAAQLADLCLRASTYLVELEQVLTISPGISQQASMLLGAFP